MSSRRYRVDQELEIYNFRVAPDLQISKATDLFNDLHVFFDCCFSLILFLVVFCMCFLSLNICCKMGWEWDGEAETGSK